MGSQFDADVVIIGGGPAGLSAGIVLARHGLRTIVCERHRFPVDKPCGEGIMPTGVADLHQLGVVPYLDQTERFPFQGIAYHTAVGETAAASFREGPGWGVRRTALSTALWRRARETVGLTLCEMTAAEPLSIQSDHLLVQINGQRLRTRLLVGADGLNSDVRRWAGLDGPEPVHWRWGVRQHFRREPWSDYVEVYWGKGVEAYVTPCGPDLVGVAFLWDRAQLTPPQAGRHLFSSLLTLFPRLQAHLHDAAADDRPRAVGPLQRRVTHPVADGVLLVGDAAGYLDALTGEGISLATAAALALSETVVPVLRRGGMPHAADLAAYARAYRAIVTPYYRLTGLVLWLSRHPRLAEQMIGALRRQPQLFQRLLSANMGLASPWAPEVLVRLLAGLLDRRSAQQLKK